MATILVTLSRGFLARNILHTGIVSRLADAGHTIVVATPAHTDPEFLATFAHPRVFFAPLHPTPWTTLDRILVGFHRNSLWNRTIRFTAKYGVYHASDTSTARYLFQLLVCRPFAAIPGIRRVLRVLDARLRPAPTAVMEQMRSIRPVLLFSTNPMEDTDSSYLKAARVFGIPSVALMKSWDNMTKTNLRVLPDDLLVWGPYMHEEARRYQSATEKQIHEVGVPQFDLYITKEGVASRKETLRRYKLDASRKTIVFGSEGKVTPEDPVIVRHIAEMIADQTLPEKAQVLVRPHFGYRGDVEKFDSVRNLSHVAVDSEYTPRPDFYDQWDYDRGHFLRLAATLGVADVLVTTASTLAIDAAVWDIPVICIAYDGDKTLPKKASVARWYETEYYSRVLATGGVVLVKNRAELRTALTAALAFPSRRAAERALLVSTIAGKTDGHAAERIALFLSTRAS